jgi:hypothetical protein
MVTPAEIEAIDDWRFVHRLPSRGAALGELTRRGMQGLDGKEETMQ